MCMYIYICWALTLSCFLGVGDLLDIPCVQHQHPDTSPLGAKYFRIFVKALWTWCRNPGGTIMGIDALSGS